MEEPINKNNEAPVTETPVTPTQNPPIEPKPESQPRPLITEDKKEGSVGPIVASVIIIILIIIGGLYFWGSVLREQGYTPGEYINTDNDSKVDELTTQSTSDEVDDIEADLNGTDLDSLDEELSDIDEAFE